MKRPICILTYFLCSILQMPTSFAIKKSYVVYLGGHSHGSEVSEIEADQVREDHYDLLGSYVGSRDNAKAAIFYSYTRHINGFAAMLEEEEAAEISKHPSVVSVFLNKGMSLHTTRTWSFLGLEEYVKEGNQSIPSYSTLWSKARFGEDTIIANIDTGVWPESKSFSDEGFGPVPSKWKGTCQNDTIVGGVRCNRFVSINAGVSSILLFTCGCMKLIGARYFNKGYLSGLSSSNTSANISNTPRDNDGHGTHTLSTAAGNFVPGANVFNFGKGVAKGGSPRARVAAYKVCWPPIKDGECFDSDVLAGFDAAIGDGVDVISASLGGTPTPYFNDSISIGSFHAVMKGIVVVCSAGNSGPADGTVSNVAPWQFTVGASTMDREFANWVVLGHHRSIKGQSLSPKSLPAGKFYPIISAVDAKAANASAQDALLCKPGSLDHRKAKGKILVCLRGVTARVDKGEQAVVAGAVGMVLVNDFKSANEVVADAHVLPASNINYTDGVALLSYVNSTKSPMAYITHAMTLLGTKPAPFMAAFSSKGPNPVAPEILKPDITAPGVSVIAAYTEAQGPTDQPFDKRRVKFNSLSGTSMSCPHVSGVVGLLKTLHPNWSPAAIKSAIMTTAGVLDNVMEPILNASNVEANPLNYGAGHLQPDRAMDPGLVYDLTVDDYLNFLCAIGYNCTSITLFSGKPYPCPKNFSLTSLNYPSIAVPDLNGSVTVSRTLKNVGSPGIYKAHIQKPKGIKASVAPEVLKFDRFGQEQRFFLTMKVRNAKVAKDYVFGQLTWSDGMHHVRSPIVVKAV